MKENNNEDNNINNYFSQNKINNNQKFSPKKTYLSHNISRNPNLFNYNKNRKLFIPINVMNIVSFINSKKNDVNNSITALNIFHKIGKKFSNNNPNIGKQMFQNNNIVEENKVILQNSENDYNPYKNNGILEKTALSTQEIPYFQNGNNYNNKLENNNNFINNNDYFNNKNEDNFSVSYHNNKLIYEKINNESDNLNNINMENYSSKFIKFNNHMVKKKDDFVNIKSSNFEFLNNQ